jgi:hypothetical protein
MTDSGNYAARATALRETAKWIAAVFVGTGAVLFSGLSFANIEKVANSPSWILPVFLATVPILAAAGASGVIAAKAAHQPTGRTRGAATAAAITGLATVPICLNVSTPRVPSPLKDGQSATVVGGTFTGPLLLFAATPATQVTSTTPRRCLPSWTWAPPANQGLVVPQTRTAVVASG